MPNNRQRGLDYIRRTLAELRADGWTAERCEVWDSQTRKARDLFGVADVAAWHPTAGFMLVQVTSRANMSARRKKIRATQPGIEHAVHFEIWGWDKHKNRMRVKTEVL